MHSGGQLLVVSGQWSVVSGQLLVVSCYSSCSSAPYSLLLVEGDWHILQNLCKFDV